LSGGNERVVSAERARHVLHSNLALVPLLVLALAIASFALVLGTSFLSPFSLSLILQQVTIVAVIGAAQTLVVLTAGIDLSVGAIMVLCSVVMGHLTFRYGLPPLAARISQPKLRCCSCSVCRLGSAARP
jgi:fructose transport system permease protein